MADQRKSTWKPSKRSQCPTNVISVSNMNKTILRIFLIFRHCHYST